MRVLFALCTFLLSIGAVAAPDGYAVVPLEREFQCDSESYVILGMFRHPAGDASALKAVGFVVVSKEIYDSSRVSTSALAYGDGSAAFGIQIDKVHLHPRDRFLFRVYGRTGHLVIEQIPFSFPDASAEAVIEDAIDAFQKATRQTKTQDGEPSATDNPDDAQRLREDH